jgi:NADH-quinone oxidoreductase subunit H
MDIAWKVMIPCGLVNLIVVAIWVEYGGRLAKYIGLSSMWSMVILGWIVIVITWFVFTIFDPTSSDNRPRRRLIAPDRQAEEIA